MRYLIGIDAETKEPKLVIGTGVEGRFEIFELVKELHNVRVAPAVETEKKGKKEGVEKLRATLAKKKAALNGGVKTRASA